MDERLEFEDNFNNKLNCQCFTTIRIHQPVRKGNARIIHATTITMDRINLPMAKLDTGLSLEECQRLIKSLYKNRPGINWKTQPLDYMVLEYVKESKEPSLF